MSKGFPRSQAAGNGQVTKTVIIPVTASVGPFAGVTGSASNAGLVVTASVGAPGFATAKIAGLPDGNILIHSAFAQLGFSSLVNGVANPNVPATFTGAFSVGTTATADNVLSGSDANIIPSVAMNAAVGSVSAPKESTVTALNLVVNNSDSVSGTASKLVPTGNSASSVTVKTGPQIGLNLNITIANVTTAAAPITVTGFVTLTYSVTGNY